MVFSVIFQVQTFHGIFHAQDKSVCVGLRRIDDAEYKCSVLVALDRYKHMLLEKECYSPVPCMLQGCLAGLRCDSFLFAVVLFFIAHATLCF